MEDEEVANLDNADRFEPYTAESVKLDDTEEVSAIWKDRFSQFKRSLDQMQDNRSEVSRLKKSIFTLYA